MVDDVVGLTACAHYSDDTEACDVAATWTSSAADVATVDSNGHVTDIEHIVARSEAHDSGVVRR